MRRVELRRWIAGISVAVVTVGATPAGAASIEDLPDRLGAVIVHDDLAQLKPWLPDSVWDHRRFFFHPGMAIEIGPRQRDYSPPPVYRDATARHRGTATLGEDGALLGYAGGQPFPVDEIACDGDPQAGVKLIWNFVHRWQGFGARAKFRYVYLDRGETLPLTYQGTTSAWLLKWRPEPRFQERGGDVFPDEKRAAVIGFEVDKPPQAAGTRTLTYRYADSFGPLAAAKPEDTWIYARQVRRIRKISQTQRSNAIAGTDFSFDDLFTFSGLPPQYDWKCLGERQLLAPMNTKALGFPYSENGSYGPSGLSYANDRWELRRAVGLEMKPKDANHPYSRKVLWIDRQTFQPLYSFAYDTKGELWKIIYHNHRWSEDDVGDVKARDWYPAWEGVPEPRDLRVVSDAIVNVQTGTGNRLDFWDSQGSPPSLGEIRRYIDVQRLRRGR
ncbi:MAG: DUF1329 domain-containing protein [Proteobacteria bacterium]|nr:DUF1329 domain-containing protein [Pseudomonadota bacterium]